ncbi:MAG: DUF3108 domain-containing protein [Solirubrobacterales bacterium]
MPRALLPAALAVVMLAAPALATGRSDAVEYRYEVSWGGIRAAEAALTRGLGTERYRAELQLVTAGLTDRLAPARFSAEAEGRQQGATAVKADRYRTQFHGEDEDKELSMAFDPFTGIGDAIERTLRGKDTADDPPGDKVPPEMRAGAVDPLSNLVLLGEQVDAAMSGTGPNRFVLKSFDGKRRYDLAAEVKGVESVVIRERRFDAVVVRLSVTPLAGFNARQMDLWKDAVFTAELDPATLLPLRIRSENFGAAAVINVVARCLQPACLSSSWQSASLR